jgi:hypothetical protein
VVTRGNEAPPITSCATGALAFAVAPITYCAGRVRLPAPPGSSRWWVAMSWPRKSAWTSRVLQTQRIDHIPKILYHWRKVPGSAAANTEAKPYAYISA